MQNLMGQAFGTLALAAVLVGAATAQSGTSDAQVEANVLRAMAGDARLANQPINSSTAFGTVTLTGAVPDEATRVAAEQVASHTAGVKKVVDQLSVGRDAVSSASAVNDSPPLAANSQDDDPADRNVLPGNSPADGAGPVNGNQAPEADQRQGYPQANTAPRQPVYGQGRPQGSYPPSGYPSSNQPQDPYDTNGSGSPANQDPRQNYPQQNYPQQSYPQQNYPQPVYGQQPQGRVYRRDWERQQQQGYDPSAPQRPYAQQGPYAQTAPASYGQVGGQPVVIARGAVLPVRITRWISSGDAEPGSTFNAVVENDILAGGYIAIPRGAEVQGSVIDAHGAGALKGRGSLTLQLNELDLGGQQIPIQSEPFTVNGHDKTVSSVNTTLGVAALGAILGGVTGGGAGAAIGAGVGGAAGLGVAAASGNGNARIPAESLLRFRLTTPVQVATLSEAEMQRLGGYAGPEGSRRPLPPPSVGYYGGPYASGPYPYEPYPYGPYPYYRRYR